MVEKTIPWWRKALEIALGSLRSGFGFFPRSARPAAFPETRTTGSSREIRKEERILTRPSSKAKIAVAAPAIPSVPATASEPAKVAEKDREASSKTEKKTTKFQEATEIETVHEAVLEPVIEPDPVIGAEPVVAQDTATETVAKIQPELERKLEAASEPVSIPATAPVAQAIEQAAAPPLQAVPEPASAPVAVPVPSAQADPRRMLKPRRSEEEKAAARLAARQKKLDEGSEESPFSVIVGQVYDGPMDLLLDLIRKQDIDIYDIPIAIITSQFLAYVNQLRASDVDVAGDFIYTASLLIHIKSKMLLPHADTGPEQAAEDPRRELVERLLEHERFKNAAQMLQQKQMLEAATWSNPGAREFKDDVSAEPEIAADTVDLVRIFRDILERARNRPVIDVEEDSVTVSQMIQFLARRLTLEDKPVALRRLLSHTHSEQALIAMFLALLEMVRLQAILLRQDRQFSEIFIKKHSNFETVMNEGLGNARDDWR
jgi:segregation and condensation protein A